MAPRGSSGQNLTLRQRTCSSRGEASRRSVDASSFALTEQTSSSSRLLSLPLDLILVICRHIPPNDVACSVRLCCSTLRDALRAPEHRMVRLSEPVQPYAFDWGLRHGFLLEDDETLERKGVRDLTRVLDSLTFEEKLMLSELVAGSGVLPNLVALHRTALCPGNCSTPRAAAAASHLHVLQWLAADGSCLSCVRVHQAVGAYASTEVLQWYISRATIHPPTLFVAACEDDDPARRAAKLQYMYDKYGSTVITRSATAAAARRGGVGTLAWLRERGCVVDATTLVGVAGGRDVAAAAWVLEHGGTTSLAALHEAASEGRVEMMEWLAERRELAVPPARWRRALAAAAGGGHCRAVTWLLRRTDADGEALEAAAEEGHCDVVRVLLGRGIPPTAKALSLAARCGSIPTMNLLMDAAAAAAAAAASTTTTAPTSTAAPAAGAAAGAAAAASGGGDILRPHAYVAAALSAGGGSGSGSDGGGGSGSGSDGGGSGSGCPVRARDCVAVLRWLEERGCPAGDAADREEAMGAAALAGSRVRMEWLRARGFGWSARTFAAAAASGCVRLVEWMAAQGCPMGRRGDALLAAGANSDVDMLGALRRLGCPWSADVLARAIHGVLLLGKAAAADAGGDGDVDGDGGMLVQCRQEVLKWMVEHGCPVTKQAYNVARRYRRHDVADWIKRSGQMQ
ncbi:hypothetical protein PLESTF_000846300 [Pleodorina starrii]|nr:hypothetical protein PLESTM_001873600 [Pleodorina starrii]GLC69550.1 hypothetical protein PLESTF_000846300 [Pleodorina starrii]